MYCLNDIDHVPGMVARDEPFHAFHRLYLAFQGFLQCVFISRRTYPIAYDKWIREQVEDLLGLPELYAELPSLVGVEGPRRRADRAQRREASGAPRDMGTLRTLKQASAWVDRVGLALLFPKDDVVLPSLWQAAGGEDEFAKRDENGKFVEWTPTMEYVWTTKDALPSQGLCAAGKHLRGRASLVSLEVLPALVALAPREAPDGIEGEVVALLEAQGPLSTRELSDLLAHHQRKHVRAALDRLQKQLVVTNAGLEDTDGWPAIVVDLVARRYADRLGVLPSAEDARAALAAKVLDVTGELTAEDVRGAFGWRKADCVAALGATGAPSRDEDGFVVWTKSR